MEPHGTCLPARQVAAGSVIPGGRPPRPPLLGDSIPQTPWPPGPPGLCEGVLMVSYRLAPEQQDLRDSVAQFAREVVAPVIGGYYERG